MDKKLLRIYQLQDGYCYNSDTLFLFDFAKNFLRNHIKLLDIGSGSGILGLLCARFFQIDLSLVEKDLHASFLARKNAKTNGISAQIYHQDIFNFLPQNPTYRFDFILSNPPFYRSEILNSKNPKISMARNEIFMPFEKLCNHIKKLLSPKGSFIFCYDAKEMHRVFSSLLNQNLIPQTLRLVYPRINLGPTLILVQTKINAKGSLKILPPLFTHTGSNQKDHSQEAQKIYDFCQTYSIKIESKDILLD